MAVQAALNAQCDKIFHCDFPLLSSLCISLMYCCTEIRQVHYLKYVGVIHDPQLDQWLHNKSNVLKGKHALVRLTQIGNKKFGTFRDTLLFLYLRKTNCRVWMPSVRTTGVLDTRFNLCCFWRSMFYGYALISQNQLQM